MAHCLAHGRRQFVNVAGSFPDECRYVLEALGEVYGHEATVRERGLAPPERLRFHQEHSAPVMQELHRWLEAQLADHRTEPNSGLAKAITYLLRHWKGLTAFLREPQAPFGQQPLRAGPEARGSSPEKCAILPNPERGPGR